MPTPPVTQADAAALLRWYVEMGVDVGIADEPADRFAESARAPLRKPTPAEAAPAEAIPVSAPEPPPWAGSAPEPPPHAAADLSAWAAPLEPVPPWPETPSRALPAAPRALTPVSAAPALLTTPPEAVVVAAREQAAAARTLDELRAALDVFEGCALKATASRLVFMDGVAGAEIMFVGEAPGRDEDRTGVPFVGRSGQLLDRMLSAIGLDRGQVAIANVVPWRPPGNRTPTPQETAICRPFIERQIALVAPKILVCLGAPSAQTLLGIRDGIMRARGRWSTYEAGAFSARAMATLHPAYLLRRPVDKRLAWRDFRALRAALAGSSGTAAEASVLTGVMRPGSVQDTVGGPGDAAG